MLASLQLHITVSSCWECVCIRVIGRFQDCSSGIWISYFALWYQRCCAAIASHPTKRNLSIYFVLALCRWRHNLHKENLSILRFRCEIFSDEVDDLLKPNDCWLSHERVRIAKKTGVYKGAKCSVKRGNPSRTLKAPAKGWRFSGENGSATHHFNRLLWNTVVRSV